MHGTVSLKKEVRLFIVFLKMLHPMLIEKTVRNIIWYTKKQTENLSTKYAGKCMLNNLTVRLVSENLMNSIETCICKCIGLKICVKFFEMQFQIFSVSPNIQQMLFDVNKTHVTVHGQRPVVTSDLNRKWSESRKCSKFRYRPVEM